MKKTLFDLDWRFSLDGSEETAVNLPHDFSIGRPRVPESRMQAHGGFYQGGNGVYRKTLNLATYETRGVVMLEVEGAYMNSEVFVNGHLAVIHPYGYTSYHADLTQWLREGENKIEIRVQNDALPNSRWYSGSGLYRHVWLLTAKESYIAPWGVYATTPVVSERESVMCIKTEVCGSGLLRHSLLDAAGRSVAKSEHTVSAGLDIQEIKVANVKLWDIDNPYLYTLHSELVAGDLSDTVETPIGIRSIALDREMGFLLNGRPIKLKGGCVHHDCGILGAAAYDRAEDRKVLAHKEAGFNAIRCAHNPPSPAFLDACDRYGILVMDEAFDCWRMGKTPYDYHLYFEDWWERDMASMIRRDRNHPCIAFWSTGNEIGERGGKSDGAIWARRLADAVRALDDTRFVSNAVCGLWDIEDKTADWGQATEQFIAPLDVAGYNYLWKRYEEDLKTYPGRFIFGTETVAGEAFESWGATLANPRAIGDCVWTSMDYIGEAGIGHAYLPDEDGRTHGLKYPWRLANCGDLDICCRPRPQSFYRQILWGHRKAPWIAVHRPNEKGLKPAYNFWGWSDVQHSWSWPGAEGFKTYIDVYCALDEVELFLNGRSLGRKPAGKAARNIASFEAAYEPGELRAVAFEGGKPACEDSVAACGIPAAIRLDADRREISSAWGDLAYVTITVVDAQGNAVPYARNELFITVSGSGELAAAGTNDPMSEEPFDGNRHSAYEGTAIAVVRSRGEAGDIVLIVSADGLGEAQIRIKANN